MSSRPALRSPGDASLELDRPVQPGDELLTEEGQRVRLGEPLTEGGETARGGEGVIYLCEQFPGLVAKIYHPGQLTAQRQEKLRTMLAHDPRIPGVCWPVHLLKNEQGQFVGYLMPRAPKGAMPLSKTVLKIGGRAVHDELMSGWTRRDLIRVAMRLAQLMERLHRKNILMGDVNAGNVMVDLTDSGSVFLVDTDSYQFDGYPCPVGTDEFTCPFVTVNGQNVARPRGQVRYGTLLRGLEEERFSLAVLPVLPEQAARPSARGSSQGRSPHIPPEKEPPVMTSQKIPTIINSMARMRTMPPMTRLRAIITPLSTPNTAAAAPAARKAGPEFNISTVAAPSRDQPNHTGTEEKRAEIAQPPTA